MREIVIELNLSSQEECNDVIRTYGGLKMPVHGKNKNGEDLSILIERDRLIIKTFGRDNDVKVNVYHYQE